MTAENWAIHEKESNSNSMEQQFPADYQPSYGQQLTKFKSDYQSALLTPDESPQNLPAGNFANMQPLTPGLLFSSGHSQHSTQAPGYQYFEYSPRPYPITSPQALQPFYNQHQNIPIMKEDLKKQQHKLAEQKRRDDAKNALTNLRDSVPFAKERKMAKVEILQAARLYIQYLESKAGDSVQESEFRTILSEEMPQD
eukprot:NODE_86_length_22075_cov_1.190253.p15 type:complete len:197 gc:universal NODE_86_length_22075_cov_1.190253:15348-14758(-)